MGRKLRMIAEGFGRTALAFSESYEIIHPRIVHNAGRIFVKGLRPGDLVHLARYVRFFTGRDTFRLVGTGEGNIRVEVRNGSLEEIELREGGSLAIVEIKKSLLDVSGEELSDLSIGGGYLFDVLVS